MHGQGKYKCANGDVYKGGWVNGSKQGQGKYTWRIAIGDVYEGAFYNNHRHGKGTLWFKGEDKQNPECVDGEK